MRGDRTEKRLFFHRVQPNLSFLCSACARGKSPISYIFNCFAVKTDLLTIGVRNDKQFISDNEYTNVI